MQTDFEGFDDLEDPDALNRATLPAKEQERFPCNACSGTGKYFGPRVHQTKAHCFACRGKGYFLSSQGDRLRAKAQRQHRAKTKLEDAQAAFEEQHPGLIEALGKVSEWNEFAASLVGQFRERGTLSDRQAFAAMNTLDKIEASRKKRRATQSANSGKVDLAPIRAMFEAASGAGLKCPRYRAEGLVLSLAPMHGKNPGAIYVKGDNDDAYLGKVLSTTYHAAPQAGPWALTSLQAIAADPLAAAVRYGRLMGSCACCGRTLTDPKSVERGIGPICAGKWGL